MGSPRVAKGSGSAAEVGCSHPGPMLLGCPTVSGEGLECSPGLLHPGHTPKLAAVLAALTGAGACTCTGPAGGRSEEIQHRVPLTHPGRVQATTALLTLQGPRRGHGELSRLGLPVAVGLSPGV